MSRRKISESNRKLNETITVDEATSAIGEGVRRPVLMLNAAFASLFEDALVGARLLRDLPSFLRHPITVEAAGAALRKRLEHRDATFLSLVERAICGNPTSPYRPPLTHAGCEYEDLLRLVRQDGVEGAHRVLYRHGVYLTPEEFKGRRPVVRGNVTIGVRPDQFRNPGSAGHVPVRSSGSGGPATSVLINLAYLRDRAVKTCLTPDHTAGAWDPPAGISPFVATAPDSDLPGRRHSDPRIRGHRGGFHR